MSAEDPNTDELQADIVAHRRAATRLLERADRQVTMSGRHYFATAALVRAQLATSCAIEQAGKRQFEQALITHAVGDERSRLQ